MTPEERLSILQDAYNYCVREGRVKTRQEFAELIGVNRSNLSSAFNGNDTYLTDRLIGKVREVVYENKLEQLPDANTVPVIPTGARAGTLADWTSSYKDYDCERMVSPIRGADYALMVSGDSMSPDYPSGSHILVKKVDEEAFIAWGEVYLLDTVNGPVLKRIRKTDREDVVECSSINPAYQPFRVECRNIFGWYRVLMCLSLK